MAPIDLLDEEQQKQKRQQTGHPDVDLNTSSSSSNLLINTSNSISNANTTLVKSNLNATSLIQDECELEGVEEEEEGDVDQLTVSGHQNNNNNNNLLLILNKHDTKNIRKNLKKNSDESSVNKFSNQLNLDVNLDKQTLNREENNSNSTNKSTTNSNTSNQNTESNHNDDEYYDENCISSSSLSSSSLSPLSDSTSSNCNSTSHTNHHDENNHSKHESNKIIQTKYNEISTDDVSNVSDSLTPTPTPTNSNTHQDKFTEFSSNSNNLTIPPPNTLALRTNYNNLNGNVMNECENHQENEEILLENPSNVNSCSSASSSSSTSSSPTALLLNTTNNVNNITNQQKQSHPYTSLPLQVAAPLPHVTSSTPIQPLQTPIYNGGLVTYSTAPPPLIYTTQPPAPQNYLNYQMAPPPQQPPSYTNFHHHLPPSAVPIPTNHHLNQHLINAPVVTPVNPTDPSNTPSTTQTTSSSTIFVHVDVGHIFQVQLGDKIREILGPATVKIVSNNNSKPVPLQLTTPAPGQLVQQILDENGILTHLIISSQQQQQHQQNSNVNTNSNLVTNTSNNNQIVYCPYQVANKATTNNYNSNSSSNTNIVSPTQPSITTLSSSLPHNTYQTHTYNSNNTGSNTNNSNNNLSSQYQSNNFHISNNTSSYQINNSNNKNFQSKNNKQSSPSLSPQLAMSTRQLPVTANSPDTAKILTASTATTLASTSPNENHQTQSLSPSSSSSCSSSTSTSISTPSTTNSSHSLHNNSLETPASSASSSSSESSILPNQTTNPEASNLNNCQNQKKVAKPNAYYINTNNSTTSNNSGVYPNSLKQTNKIYKKFTSKSTNLITSNGTSLAEPNSNQKKFYVNSSNQYLTNNKFHYYAYCNQIENSNLLTNKLLTNQKNKLYNSNSSYYLNYNNHSQQQAHHHHYASNSHFNQMNQSNSINNNIHDNNASAYSQHHHHHQQHHRHQINPATNYNNKNKIIDENDQAISNNNSNNGIDENEDHYYNEDLLIGNGNTGNLVDDEYMNGFDVLGQNYKFFATILSNMKEPLVCDIEARSVLVRLSPIELENFLNNNNVKSDEESDETTTTGTGNIANADIIKIFENLNYNLELSSELNTFNKVYTGDANEITLKDLRPNTKYYLRVFASLSVKCRGDCTNAVCFQTLVCQPDQPAPPKLTGKKKNELTLRWSNSSDNGSKIINFVLEYKEIKENDLNSINQNDQESSPMESSYIQLYKGPLKQFIVKKLVPSQCYAFRVAAENSVGTSEFSKPAFIYTAGSVPNVPEAAQLLDATKSSLTLGWGPKRVNDVDFELQMLDLQDPTTSSHGFLTIYNGSMLMHHVVDLKRASSYQFRLRAQNEEGCSAWSEIRKYSTLADVPKCPQKVKCKSFRVTWEKPKDDGGDLIKSYLVEIAELESSYQYEVIYDGNQLECAIEKILKPGTVYLLRVACSNSIGLSEFSEICQFQTPAGLPGKCMPPKIVGKPKSNSTQLKWSYPDQDGGAPIISYQVKLLQPNLEMENDEDETKIVYKGNELNCLLSNLLPGRNYLTKLRAQNKVGFSEWSDSLEFTSGSGVPDAPSSPPTVIAKSASCLVISWPEASCNGSPITEYRLEWSLKENEQFSHIYSGTALKYELKSGIQPSTHYIFRVQAININGSSQYSAIGECLTPASVPSIINTVKLEEIKSDSIKISWRQPASNGSPILFYNLDFSENNSSTGSTSIAQSVLTVIYNQEFNCDFNIEALQPDTIYKFRLQAANSIGVGQFSNLIKVKTKALPPQPPHLECISTSYNSIKLKWTNVNSTSSSTNNNSTNSISTSDSSLITSSSSTRMSMINDNQIIYNLEMLLLKNVSTQDDQDESKCQYDEENSVCVYKGPLNIYKINKLQESSEYAFRISASNEAGQGKWSSFYKFNTTKSPPVILKGPSVSEVTTNSCTIEWPQAKISQGETSTDSLDTLEYSLQLQSVRKDSDYKEIYKGDASSFRLKDLEPNTEYNVRVSAIRITTNAQRICSPYSPHTSFLTQKLSTKSHGQASRPNNEALATDASSSYKSNTSNPSTSKYSGLNKSSSFWSRLIWPSFNLNMNSSSSKLPKTSLASTSAAMAAARKARLNDTVKNQKHLTSNQSIISKRQSHMSNGKALLANEPASMSSSITQNDAKLQSRQYKEKLWAIFLIFIFLGICFLLAFTVDYIYSSYHNEATTDNSNVNVNSNSKVSNSNEL